jgi:hypothetical protein
VSDPTGLEDHFAMPGMHAVEVADGDGGAANLGRQILEVAKDAHG